MISILKIIARPWVGVTIAVMILLLFILPDIYRTQADDEGIPVLQPEIHVSPATTVFTPPFHTRGRHIQDAEGRKVKLASINWYGASDIHFIPSGLDVQHRDDIAQLIRNLGFNSVRLPYADEMVDKNPVINSSLIASNMDLLQTATTPGEPTALDVYHAVVESLTAAGLLVIVNNHITQATWCCGINLCDTGWSNDWFGGSLFCRIPQTEEQWIRNWETVMRPLAGKPLVLGADLRNEPRGLWGTLGWEDWASAAEKASERLLDINPDWLMIMEGISSANDLSRVRERPVQLSRPGRVVYSAHVYKWSGWGDLYPYSQRTYGEFAAAMDKNWAYLLSEHIAPVWVGEFGMPGEPSAGDQNYWNHLVQFLAEVDTSWGYWALNARKPDGEFESYGLVGDSWDWSSVRWDSRLEDLRALGLIQS
jgi:aryl-phospho-beta-D-glucosidase BglC (GH1 family)